MPIIIDNKVIETPVRNILNMLQQQLYAQHINKLRNIEYKITNARITCPIHKNGNENKPSCDILLVDKGDIPAGTVHCFSCGYKANIVKFIADCLNISYRAAKEWLLSFSDYSYVSDIRDINTDIFNNNDNDNVYSKLPGVTIDELKQYDYIHKYMFERKLNMDIINKFEVGYDPKTDSLTFPVYVNGKCLFVAKRRVSYKRFDMPEIYPKPIYGMCYIDSNEVIVCESVINCLTCWSYGYQAIALFGTGSTWQLNQLNNSDIRHFILMFDGDEAGRKGADRFKLNVKNSLITDIKMPDGKDVNDLSKEEFNKLLNNINYI